MKVDAKHGNWTKVPNLILDEILGRGLLKPNEMRIAIHIIRQTFGFHRKWSRKLTHREIAEKTTMAQQTVSANLRRMVVDKIIENRSKHYRFNADYRKWNRFKNANAEKQQGQESLSNQSRNLSTSIKNLDTEQHSKSMQESDGETPKENCKESSKENSANRIFRFWNYLADREQRIGVTGLLEVRSVSERVAAVLNKRLEDYTERDVKWAIYNYHRFMCLPADEKSHWMGYCWTLFEFLNHAKDNIARFKRWDVVTQNWLMKTDESDQESSIWER